MESEKLWNLNKFLEEFCANFGNFRRSSVQKKTIRIYFLKILIKNKYRKLRKFLRKIYGACDLSQALYIKFNKPSGAPITFFFQNLPSEPLLNIEIFKLCY